MIKKISFLLFSLLVLFPSLTNAAPTPSSSPTPEPVDSYTLFWPVVAGTVPGQPLYPLKLVKEKIREVLIFSDYRKADYNITLSVKRVVEGEKLFLDVKDYKNAKEVLDAAQEKRKRALNLIEKVGGTGKSVTDLKTTLAAILGKQRTLLLDIQSKVPESEKSVISQDLERIETLLSQLQ